MCINKINILIINVYIGIINLNILKIISDIIFIKINKGIIKRYYSIVQDNIGFDYS